VAIGRYGMNPVMARRARLLPAGQAAKFRRAGQAPPRIRVLLIDPSPLRRSCFLAGLAGQTALSIVAHARIEAVERAPRPLAPDLVVLRLGPDDVTALHLNRQLIALHRIFPGAATMVIGPSAEPRRMMMALRHGVCGFITADLGVAATIEAMQLVHEGFAVYPQLAIEGLRRLTCGVGRPAERRVLPGGYDTLTARQYDVLRLLAAGMPNKAIAYELGISDSTVKVHIRAIMERMGLANRTQAAARFLNG
jgi:DNA-binding NarL/FixJ family response regulator